MFEALIVTFREGIEAFLIVAITLAYLYKTGRQPLAQAVYWGIAVAVGASAYLGYFLQEEVAGNPLAEGIMALAAAVLVTTLVIYMMRVGKQMRRMIHDKIDRAAERQGLWAYAGVFAFTVLMITREGMETALLISTIIMEHEAMSVLYGALAGVAAAAVLGYMWVKYSHLINLGLFMQVTSVFLLLFSIQLFGYGFHELTEAFVLPIDNAYWHEVTEPIEDGLIGDIIGYSIIVVPMAWLGVSILKNRRKAVAA